MPRGDGTGPLGQGPGLGRGRGPRGAGPVGRCVCPVCGTTVPHGRGTPCSQISCPKCGARMTRG